MKKYIVVFFCLWLSMAVYSQNFEGGILGGMSATQVDGDTYAGFNNIGFQIGGFVARELSVKSLIQMEIKYIGKGAKKKTSVDDPTIYELHLHYIDLPLSLQYEVQDNLYLEAGLEPGYLFKVVGEDDYGPLPENRLQSYKEFDLSWMLGIQYRINDNFKVGARYAYSLFSISTIPHETTNYSGLARTLGYTMGDYNNYLSFALYYQLY